MQRNPYVTYWGYLFGKMFIFSPLSIESKLLMHSTAREQIVIATKKNQGAGQKCDADFTESRQFTGSASACPMSYFSKFDWRVYLQYKGKHK